MCSSICGCFYHHIYIDEDKDRALHEAKSFLDRYYSANYTEERLQSWLTYGSARECIADLRKFRGSGAHRITLRLSTEKKESEQFASTTYQLIQQVNASYPYPWVVEQRVSAMAVQLRRPRSFAFLPC
ncbi:MAG: hypothetical protein ACXWC1_22810, partial [Burkholderiales bacterium]